MDAERLHFIFLLVTCFLFVAGDTVNENKASNNHTANEDKIKTQVVLHLIKSQPGIEDNAQPSNANGVILTSNPEHVITSNIHVEIDDEDLVMSGSGSGSGGEEISNVDTPLTMTSIDVTSTTMLTSSESHESSSDVSATDDTPVDLDDEGEVNDETSTTLPDVINEMTSDNVIISDVIYNGDVWPPKPVKEEKYNEKVSSERQKWSLWIRTNNVTEVRLRTCTGSTESCNGTEAELRHCDTKNKDCDVTSVFLTSKRGEQVLNTPCTESNGDDIMQPVTFTNAPLPKKTSTPPPPSLPSSAHHDSDQESNPCTYSLYDVKKGKYRATQWSLSRLVTQAKARYWCSKSERYVVLISPASHCRRYLQDLCHVSVKCKGRRTPPRSHGDLTDKCWRQFVYNNQLPRGLSSQQSNLYLICQRFAPVSTLGQMVGHRGSHFVTVFDTKGRVPIASMIRITMLELEDLGWPHSDNFIEHGLIEDTHTSGWLLQKPRSGLVQMKELGQCSQDYPCHLGAHQALPSDYTSTSYLMTPLLWPELCGINLLTRTATLTLTNMAPMHPDLHPLWRQAVMRVRSLIVTQCGVPQTSPEMFEGKIYHRGSENASVIYPAAYVMSGVVPSRDPIESIGNDINVPTMFWMAVCCVKKDESRSKNVSRSSKLTSFDNDGSKSNSNNDQYDKHSSSVPDTMHLSFSMYARNTRPSEGQGLVVAAPVAELEQLLQDVMTSSPMDPEVRLFPGSEGKCRSSAADLSSSIYL